ncbi:MAG: prepilin-type N-terminal cleavage/methylation domain-containing protein [Phycisphaeraceae bacterium]
MLRATQSPRSARPVIRAFTLVELLLVITIIGVIMGMAAPMLRGSDASRIRDAARLLAADLDLARSESIAHFDNPRRLVIDDDNLGYHITYGDGSTPITDAITKTPYTIRFGTGRAAELASVSIASHNLGSPPHIEFGIYGQTNLPADATITLAASNYRITLTIDAGSGDIYLGQVSKP